MTILCTFPGRYGDLLWSLPTIRAISETYDEPVSLVIGQPFASIVPLLAQQPYIREAWALPEWQVQDTAPMSPRVPPAEFSFDNAWIYGRIFHLGYEGWPLLDLPHETEQTWLKQYRSTGDHETPVAIDLHRPWITVTGPAPPTELAVGFTEEWFELKLGIACALERLGPDWPRLYLTPKGSRWTTEVPYGVLAVQPCDWVMAARIIRNSDVFLGCCSALHVLSCALGMPTVVMEPNPHRHHPIFWPYGMSGDRVTCVLGNDGKPTFDARHVRETLDQFLFRSRT